MNYSEQIHLAIYGSLPSSLQMLVSQPQRVSFEATSKPTNPDDAIITMGILSHNLNTLFSGVFSKISIAELMLFASGMNPINEGLLLSSLALYNADFDFRFETQVTPITGEDDDGNPVETGKSVTITPTSDTKNITSFEVNIPALGATYKASVGEAITFEAGVDISRVTGTISATLKDGAKKVKDFVVDLFE